LPITINNQLPKLITTTIQRVIEEDIPNQMLSYTTLDTKGKQVSSQNGRGSTTWDRIYITILQKLKSVDGINATIYKRGNWHMLLIHDFENKVLMTLIREERLKTVLNELKKGSLHYKGSMVREFNNHLGHEQLCIDGLEIVNNNQEYSDAMCIQQILNALQEQDTDKISEVITVCFSSFNHELRTISAVQIDRNYSIVKYPESSWNHYIEVRETGTAENLEATEVPTPSKRVKLTHKGQQRQQRR